MLQRNPSAVLNYLLRAMAEPDRSGLVPHLERVPLKRAEVILQPDAPFEYVYFLESGVASIVATPPDGRRIEVGLYGREGFGSTAIVLGDDRSAHEHIMQIPGEGLRLSAKTMLKAIQHSPSLNGLLLKYARVLQLQMAQTALSNGNYSLAERLARWLLMCHDRVDGDEISITHQALGIMLAVRRSGVTLAIQTLESAHIIRAFRGCLIVRDRAKLEEIAGGSYGPAEAAYERLIGPMR